MLATYRYGHDVILDHCSASWSVDEIQNNLHANNPAATQNNGLLFRSAWPSGPSFGTADSLG